MIVFVDDILLYSRSKEDHAKHFHTILGELGKQKLYAKFSKREFLFKSWHFWDMQCKIKG